MHKRILLLIAVNLIFIKSTLANSIQDLESSAESQLNKTQINLVEISFNNTQADFFKFSVESSQKAINLKNLEFYDDRIFKKIEQDFSVPNGSIITLTFNSDEEDSAEELQLFSTQKGLTSTTEQIIIKKQNYYFDFFCWYKSPISKSETEEYARIWRNGFGFNENISSCFKSDTLKKDQALMKDNQEWVMTKAIKDEKATVKSESIFIDEDSTSPENPPLRITEIFPAPAEKISPEWIELKNTSEQNINLKNWIIDDDEGGSKPKRILQNIIIAPQKLTTINLSDYKINLNNSSDSFRIFSPSGALVAMQEYSNVQKESSYSLITIENHEHWEWTDTPTPGQPNPQLKRISGTITSPAQFDQIHHFTLTTTNQEKILVTFEEKVIKGPLAKSTFTKGIEGKFTGETKDLPINPNFSKTLKLHSYEIESPAIQKSNSPPITIAGIILLLISLVFLGYKKIK